MARQGMKRLKDRVRRPGCGRKGAYRLLRWRKECMAKREVRFSSAGPGKMNAWKKIKAQPETADEGPGRGRARATSWQGRRCGANNATHQCIGIFLLVKGGKRGTHSTSLHFFKACNLSGAQKHARVCV